MIRLSVSCWLDPAVRRTANYVCLGQLPDIHGLDADIGFGSTIEFREEELLLLRSGYVRELALASYPHIHCGGGDFPCVAGGVCGERRLT